MNRVIRTACALLMLAPLFAAAQNWPARPVRIVIPFTPGGGSDTTARILSQKMGENTGQNFIADNKPGAGGNIAFEFVAKAEPDGYTLLYSPVGIAINPTLFSRVNYRIEDFTAITHIGEAPLLVVANNALPVRSLSDFIKLARSHPGGVRFASSGTGSSSHLASEVLGMMAGLKMVHVPYKGGPQALHDVIGGQLEFVTLPMPETLPQVRAGRVRALGQTGIKRSPNAPDIPTLDEAGVKGYSVMTWYVVFAPSKTPDAVIQRIHAEFEKALKVRDVQDRLRAAGITEIVGAPPEAAAQFVRSEYQRWGKVIRELGIKAN
ncbi:MAG: Bug family tripartite tricarboxylate transporter substrate binding protein [Rhodospirillaceae bacterium]